MNKEIVEYYVNAYKTDDEYEHYVIQEKALQNLFTKIFKRNDNLNEVLIKVAALNKFYNTGILSVYEVANHIVDLSKKENIDEKIENGCDDIVEKISNVEKIGRKLYSFATKYCCQHNYNHYPIYDSRVLRTLKEYKNLYEFQYSTTELKNYENFKKLIDGFRKEFSLNNTEYNYKKFDNFLWLYGKDLKTLDKNNITIPDKKDYENIHKIAQEIRKKQHSPRSSR